MQRDGVSRLRPHFYLAVARPINARIVRRVPPIITDAPTGHLYGNGGGLTDRHSVERTAVVH